MVTILMMAAKVGTLGLFKIKVFWIKVYDVIISVHDFIKKFITWLEYFVDVILRKKFGNSSISVRKVMLTAIL